MRHIITTDNNCGKTTIDDEAIIDLNNIAGRSIDSLRNISGQNLWLFPPKGDRYDDKIENEPVFTICGNSITTSNIMGFIGCGETELTIRSRFSYSRENDWFMQYMLQKVFAINVFDLKHSTSTENSLDIASLILPHFLQKALRQGLYREYRRKQYNDDRVKGSIDANRHIKLNYPFQNGRIAYNTREYTYDNSITQLIRHAIEYIKSKEKSAAVLYSSSETVSYINQIIEATPSYRKSDIGKILLANAKPKIHPYYSEYLPLQTLCLQILRHQKLSYGSSGNKIYGILFDGSWLWEEYLSVIFKENGYDHPENRKGKGAIYPFKNRLRYARYPDFIKPGIIADAKYKFLYGKDSAYDYLSREDLNQMISYLHITSSRIGIFVNPLDSIHFSSMDQTNGYLYNDSYSSRIGELTGDGGDIYIVSLNIPNSCKDYRTFCERMNGNEKCLSTILTRIENGEISSNSEEAHVLNDTIEV